MKRLCLMSIWLHIYSTAIFQLRQEGGLQQEAADADDTVSMGA